MVEARCDDVRGLDDDGGPRHDVSTRLRSASPAVYSHVRSVLGGGGDGGWVEGQSKSRKFGDGPDASITPRGPLAWNTLQGTRQPSTATQHQHVYTLPTNK